jgi:hypothetical protein
VRAAGRRRLERQGVAERRAGPDRARRPPGIPGASRRVRLPLPGAAARRPQHAAAEGEPGDALRRDLRLRRPPLRRGRIARPPEPARADRSGRALVPARRACRDRGPAPACGRRGRTALARRRGGRCRGVVARGRLIGPNARRRRARRLPGLRARAGRAAARPAHAYGVVLLLRHVRVRAGAGAAGRGRRPAGPRSRHRRLRRRGVGERAEGRRAGLAALPLRHHGARARRAERPARARPQYSRERAGPWTAPARALGPARTWPGAPRPDRRERAARTGPRPAGPVGRELREAGGPPSPAALRSRALAGETR